MKSNRGGHYYTFMILQACIQIGVDIISLCMNATKHVNDGVKQGWIFLHIYDITSKNLPWRLDEGKQRWITVQIYGTNLVYEYNKACTKAAFKRCQLVPISKENYVMEGPESL